MTPVEQQATRRAAWLPQEHRHIGLGRLMDALLDIADELAGEPTEKPAQAG